MAAKKPAKKKKPEPVVQKQPPKKYYQNLFHEDPIELEIEVERWIDKGWRLAGGVGFSPKGYFQTIHKVR